MVIQRIGMVGITVIFPVIRERYELNAVSPENIHVQAMCDAILTTSKGQEQGQGVLEQLVIGPHAPSGFTELMDFA